LIQARSKEIGSADKFGGGLAFLTMLGIMALIKE